jgi:hypothetical protein
LILEEVDDDNKGVVSIVFSPNGESPNMVNAQILCKTKRDRDLKVSTFLVARVCVRSNDMLRARFALAQFFFFFFFPVLFFFFKGCYEVNSVENPKICELLKTTLGLQTLLFPPPPFEATTKEAL